MLTAAAEFDGDLGQRLIPTTLPAAGADLSPAVHPHAATINLAAAQFRAVDAVESTGLTRDGYLDFIESQVHAFRSLQDAEGRIIDPVEKREMQYATPCYAHSISVLQTAGRLNDAELLESGMKAMDRAVWAMRNNKAPDHHGDFFTWPVMLALAEFKSVAPQERWQKWHDDLAQIDPSKLYNFYNNRQSLNWVLVHSAGEFLRHQAKMNDGTYVERMLDKQDHHFTADGMYSEGGQPIAYDLFSRLYITGMLAHGYEGGHADLLRDRMWRAAWMSMLMQSPTGEAPTGHRSSQHVWVEAEQSFIFEASASASAKAGRADDAARFKRAARLSQRVLMDWRRPDGEFKGSGYVVKNKFPPEAKHAYENYSTLTQYNLLAASMTAQAYQIADDSIVEQAAPADVGGYVLSVEPFHKIFVTAKGAYVEYETRGDGGDRDWVPTGIVRIHFAGANAQIGPSDGVGTYANKKAEDNPSYSVGPAWRDSTGKWTRLASLRLKTLPKLDGVEQSAEKSVAVITYSLEGGVTVTQRITVEPKRVTVEDTIGGEGIDAVRAYFPMLVNDGAEDTEVTVDGSAVTLRKSTGGPVAFSVEGAKTLERTGLKLVSRNGLVEPIFAEIQGNTIRYEITTP